MAIQSSLLPKLPDEPDAEEQDEIAADEASESIRPVTKKRNGSDKQGLVDDIDDHNLARHFDRQTLDALGMLVVREFQIDVDSRAEWKDEAEKALKFATQESEPKQYPWPKSSSFIYPLITTAALQFWAKAYPAIIQNRNVVKGVVWGDDDGTPATQDGTDNSPPKMGPNGQPLWIVKPGEKRTRADKIGEHMSYQLLEEIKEWEAQTSTLLMQMPIVGGAVRKTFRSMVEECNSSVLVPLMNIVWNFHAASFEAAPRHTEILTLYPHEVRENELADETFLPLLYGSEAGEDGETDQNDTEAPRVFLEQHRRYDLDGDGYPEPIIVTVHKQSSRVVRIVARYDEDGIKEGKDGEILRIEPECYYTLYPFLPNPKGGSHPVGFGHLLKPLNEGINTSINQMFDAGHLQIAGGGFIGSGMSIHAGPVNFQLGQYKPVNTKGGNIRDSIFPMPWPGPNQVLFELLGFLVQAAKETASIQDIMSDPGIATAAPTTMLALIETGMRVYTAIYKGVFGALKSEFSKLYRLNRLYMTEDQKYRIGDTWRDITPSDYRLGGGVEPIADPTMVTDMQRLGRAAVLLQFKDDPLFKPIEVRRRYLEAAQIDKIDEVLMAQMPPPQPSIDQQEIQLKSAALQSKVGQERALELMQYTQAVLNFQKAKSVMSEPQIALMENQLDLMRLHIEALNTTVKAADVDMKARGHDVALHGHNLAHAARMHEVSQRAREVANEQPGPTGGQPGSDGDAGAGIPALAPPTGDQGGDAVPPGPGIGLPQGPVGPLGSG